MIVSILFWVWEMSLPVRGAWERGGFGEAVAQKEKDGTQKPATPPKKKRKKKLVAFSHLIRTLPFLYGKRRFACGCRWEGERGRAAARAGQPGGGCSSAPTLSAVREGGFHRVAATGRAPAPRGLPGAICKHFAGDGRPAGGGDSRLSALAGGAAGWASAAAASLLNSWVKNAVF